MKNKRLKLTQVSAVVMTVCLACLIMPSKASAQEEIDEAVPVLTQGMNQSTSNNLALKKSVTYSGVEGGKVGNGWKYPQFAGEMAVDGNADTRWSADKTDKQWLIVDLGEIYDVGQIRLNLHAQSPDYDVLISLDGENYQSVFQETAGVGGKPIKKTIVFKQSKAQFIKYQQNKQWLHTNGQKYGSSIIELEVYESAPKPNKIKLDQNAFNLGAKHRKQLTYKFAPDGVDEETIPVAWSSSHPEIASVSDSGEVTALTDGQATITVSAENNTLTDQVDVTVTENAEYQVMRERWLKRIVGDETLDLSDPDINKYVKTINTEGQKLWDALNKDEKRTYLWEKLVSDTISADYSTQFNNIKKLALAYGLKGSDLKGNEELYGDILKALDFMVKDKNFNGSYWVGNWWDWQIGSLQPFVDTLMIVRDDLVANDYERLVTYIKSITGYAYDPGKQWPNYNATGANRTDIGISVLGAAILVEDDAKMELVKERIPDVFKLVTTGDGLYADGSLIQHGNHAYTGSYGNELLKGVGRIQSIIAGSTWEITDPSIANVFNTIEKGYLPLVHKGQMISMVNGRSISRAPGTNPFTTEFAAGSETIANILLVAQFAPENSQKKFKGAVKYWLTEAQATYNFFENSRDIEALLSAKEVLNDPTLAVELPYQGMRIYGSMARAIQVNEQYTAAVSMYSKRIANYEFGNTENKRGWHTADGALYLYTNDLTQYGEGYWPTVDSYRLAGTTIDTAPLAEGAAQSKTSPETWVGGAENGQFGAVGMSLNKSNLDLGMDLTAKKSWFMLADKVVALGTDIKGTTDKTIETIVENRLLNQTGSNKVLINGEVNDGETKSQKLKENSWVHLAGEGKGNDIGYYFPEGETVTTAKETRTGSYKDINGYFISDQIYSKNYFKLLIDYGQKVENGDYSYVLLPGKTAAETNAFAKENQVTILKNTKDIQAVEDLETGTEAANIWSETGADFAGLTLDKAASVVITSEGSNKKIAISDPKQTDGKLTVKLATPYQEVVSKDETIQVLADGKTLVIDTNKSAGASHHFIVKVASDKKLLEQKVKEVMALNAHEYTTETWEQVATELMKAQALLANEEVAQWQIDSQLAKLSAAVDGLELIGSDIPVTSLSLNVNSLVTLKKGKTMLVSPTVMPENASDKKIKWQVGNSKYAEINLEGEVKGLAVGTTKVTAETSNGKKASFTLRVTQ